MSHIKKLLASLYGMLTSYINNKTYENEQRRMQLKQQAFHQYANCIGNKLCTELFQILGGYNSSFLCKIASTQDIRITNYQKIDTGIIYIVVLNATSIPANCILSQIQQDINYDISHFRNEIIQCYGGNMAYNLYPLIIGGISVINISGNGKNIILNILVNLG